MESNNNKYDCITSLFAGFVIVAIVAICFIVEKIDGLGNTSIVLAFIGILATFVVISNYAQMLEIRNKTKDDIEQRQRDLSIMNQKIDALAKGFGVEEIAIRELFDYCKLNIVQFDRCAMCTYYVVYKDERKPVLVKVSGAPDQKKAIDYSPKEYLDLLKDDELKKEKKQVLLIAGFMRNELE